MPSLAQIIHDPDKYAEDFAEEIDRFLQEEEAASRKNLEQCLKEDKEVMASVISNIERSCASEGDIKNFFSIIPDE